MIDNIIFANAVWYSASTEYQTRIPLATRDNIVAVGNAILEYDITKNEFLTNLVNKISKTIISSKMAENKLAFMRGEDLGVGDTIEDIFVEIANSTAHSRAVDGSNNPTVSPFQVNKPSVKVIYHRIDRELKYKVTIYDTDIKRAFASNQGIDKLVSAIIDSLYSAKNHDDYIFTKQLFGSYKKYFEVNVTAPTTDATSKALAKAIKKYSEDMTFMSNKYNGQGVMTFTSKDDQILLLHKDAKVNIDIEYLAGVFNLSKAEMEARIVVVDDFGDLGDTYAILTDKNAPKIHKTLESTETIRNPDGRYTNYFVNSDGFYSISQFANLIVFKKKTDAKVVFVEANDKSMTIVVKSGLTVIEPLADGSYRLPAGTYAYTASGEGFVTQTDVALVITANQATGADDVSETVTLVAGGG